MPHDPEDHPVVPGPGGVGTPARRPPLRTMLAEAHSGMLLFAVTPPRRSASAEQIEEVARVTVGRLAPLDLDGLVLYDIDDESDRNPADRPFPYLPTIDPAVFHADHLRDWRRPVVVYRCVGKYPEAELGEWLGAADVDRVAGVFVGASSGQKTVHTRLRRAHELRRRLRPDLPLGAVAITERYTRNGDEHLRMLAKQEAGCGYFITQVVYDVSATKSLLSDYLYACRERGLTPRPVILTLSVCGSLKTLAFLQWLGVEVPRWLENALRHADDPLTESYEQCLANAAELITFCRRLGLPFGFNVESVSIRKVEIDASVELAAQVRRMLDAAR
ncbi:methylenetetrahydrofolate reductase [Plantactinospora sonchi]|uniref:5,10-methylenetetrahydrofolate reductase n=1 Tax=Plantactinospora sonchi TaxID=1544735 RepID=A0ABU7RYI3_9ACTN